MSSMSMNSVLCGKKTTGTLLYFLQSFLVVAPSRPNPKESLTQLKYYNLEVTLSRLVGEGEGGKYNTCNQKK